MASIMIFVLLPMVTAAQSCNTGAMLFTNRYRNGAEGYISSSSRFSFGAGMNLFRLKYLDSSKKLLLNLEASLCAYQGKAKEVIGSHFGSSGSQLEFKKILFQVGWFPFNLHFFKRKIILSLGIYYGTFLYSRTSGFKDDLNLKDTFVPGYGHINYPYSKRTIFQNERIKGDPYFLLQPGFKLRYQPRGKIETPWAVSILGRWAVTRETWEMEYAFPRQFGISYSYNISGTK